MAQKSDKRTTIILLVILSISIIGGGIWTYNTIKPVETDIGPVEDTDSLTGLSINTVYAIKEKAINNIVDFLETKNSPDTIWNDFYNDKQFNRLKDLDLDSYINIDNYKHNSTPFVTPSSTKEEE